MADTRGVFSLGRAFTRSKKGTWVTPDQSFASTLAVPPNVGYSGGGQGPASTSSFAKTNFADDTSSDVPSAKLIAATTNIGGIGNPSNGYMVGGGLPTVTTTNKLSYASETVSISPGSTLTAARYSHGTLGRQEFAGYVIGGGDPNYLYPKSTAMKLTYAVDTFSDLPSAYMSSTMMQVTGASNTTQAIFGTGTSPAGSGFASGFNRLTFSTESTALVPGVNTITKSRVRSTGNDTHGYFAGGEISGGTQILSTVTKYTYSSDTVTNIPGTLTIPKQNAGCSGNSSDGYVIGGLNKDTAPTTFYSSVDKIDYATDNVSRAPGANLSSNWGNMGSASGRGNGQNESKKSFAQSTQNLRGNSEAPNTGYITGGEPGPGPYISSTEKLNLSTETTAASPASPLPDSTYGGAAFSSPGALYSTGGQTPGGTQSRIAKLSYSTETYAYTGNFVSAARLSVTGTDTSTAGYLAGGGVAPTYYSLLSKISWATDTSRDLPAANLSIARGTFASGGNQSFGYFAGGEYPAPNTHTSRIDKVFYNSETSSILPDNLTQSKFGLIATGGPEAVYFTQGYSPAISSVSTTNKVSYSTDTLQNIPSAYSTYSANDGQGGTGNSTYGYWGGGASTITSVNRVDYSTDITVRVPGMNMTQGRNRMGGAGARSNDKNDYRTATPTLNQSLSTSGIPNFGYMAGGSGPGSTSPLSSIGKYNFETDTRLPFTGQLSIARYIGASGSSSTAGYIAMGLGYIAPTYYRHSRVDKLTFATENVAPVPGANTVVSLQNSCGASSSLAAYFSGGAPGPVSTTQKLTFSAETTAAIPGAALSGNRDSPRAGASSSAMYMCGGVVPGSVPLSTVDKLIFSTDTTSVTPSAALNGTRYVGAMAGNATKGYYGGGLRYTGSYVGLSDINKINYSTDTTQLIGASLSRSSWNIGATGNATKAYFAGGVPGSLSTVDKLDYATETTTLAEPLSGTRYGVIGVSGRVNAGAYTSNIL